MKFTMEDWYRARKVLEKQGLPKDASGNYILETNRRFTDEEIAEMNMHGIVIRRADADNQGRLGKGT